MMDAIFAITAGTLVAAAIYMLLQRLIVKLIAGLVLLSYAVNITVFTSAGLIRAHAPILESGQLNSGVQYADPFPQAFILTAIVINFGVLAFALVLFMRLYAITRSENIN